jgi:hypothetical protein
MQQALYALVYHTEQTRPISKTESAIGALREALTQPDELGPLPEPAGKLWELRTPRGKQPFRYYTPEQVREMLAAEREARQEAQRRVAELQERINRADRDQALAVAIERERWLAAASMAFNALALDAGDEQVQRETNALRELGALLMA